MAAHNAPKHDFAPAWLKIPTQENPKPSGPKQIDSEKSSKLRQPHKDDYYGRHGPDYARLHRQHSFENYFDGKRGGPPNKYRHHSVDDEYYPYPPYGHYGYYNGYGMHYSSNPSIFRSPPNRDTKYPQHPNVRYSQMNGAYPGYYDLYNFDYYGDPYFNSYSANSRAGSKRNHYDKEGRSNSKEGKDKDNEKTKNKDSDDQEKPTFQEDFPSLNGEEVVDKSSNKLTNGGGGVWEHPPHGKIGSSKFGERGQTANIYKSLVPNKGSLNRKPNKDSLRFNGGFPVANKSMSPPGLSATKDGSRQSPTPPMEILNTRLVTQPRNLGDKKSDFLKALRKENSETNADVSQDPNGKNFEDSETLTNGLDSLDLNDPSGNHLSRSLEAEQRLLKEMGWTENDEEEYEITEDDKKKFQDLCSKQIQTQRNGRLNKTLSPKHVPFYQPNIQELNDTLSSSDSDSEDNM